MRGMEMMFTSALKAFGIEPEAIMKTAEQVIGLLNSADKRLARIEERQARIEAALISGGHMLPMIDETMITIEQETQVNGKD